MCVYIGVAVEIYRQQCVTRIDIQAPEFMGQATAKCTILIWTMELKPPHKQVTCTTTGKG